MPMLPGPVFSIELVTTARRSRYFVLRTIYGAILLFVLWQGYQARFWWQSGSGREISVREMAQFAGALYYTFAVTQAITVLLLTPVMMAGVIADEKQRRTLHYLLASQLSSAEIVLGKLVSRLLHVAVFLAVGIPILSLLTLFGGIPPELVGLSYLLTASGVCFLAGLSILVSTYARTVREAVIVVYLLIAVWLVAPPLLTEPLRDTWPGLHALVEPLNEWVLATSPLSLISGLGPYAPGTPLWQSVSWTVGLQLLLGAAFVSLAIWRLRPVFRAQMGEAPLVRNWRARFGRPWRILPRPPVHDQPMLWKELHVVRSGGMVRWVVRACAALGLSLLAYWTFTFAIPAIDAAWRAFPNSASRGYGPVRDFNGFLRFTTGLLYSIWILGVTANACASVSAEKEEDTWLSLLGTPLSSSEILVPKMIGSAWRMRALAGTMLSLWLLGLTTGAIHPLGLLCLIGEWSIFTWFATALGVSLSLRTNSTTRATAAAQAILICLNGGYLLCCIPVQPDTVLVALGCSPFILVLSAFTGEELHQMLGHGSSQSFNADSMDELIALCVLGTLAYLAAAVALTRTSLAGFDDAVDRPHRDSLVDRVKGVGGRAKGARAELD